MDSSEKWEQMELFPEADYLTYVPPYRGAHLFQWEIGLHRMIKPPVRMRFYMPSIGKHGTVHTYRLQSTEDVDLPA